MSVEPYTDQNTVPEGCCEPQDKSKESILLKDEVRSWWIERFMRPLERLCIYMELAPNTITWVGASLSLVSCYLFASGHILWGGWFVLFQGSIDILDGRVARATGKVSQQGSFLDSVLDRYQDFALLAGLLIYFRHQHFILSCALLALAGTFFVSYIRAKADALGVDVSRVGTMQRPERIFLIGVSAIFGSIVQIALMPFYGYGYPPPHHILMGAIIVLAVLTNWTAIHRLRYVMRQLQVN